MKNIHILPTDKPSRLYLGNNGNFVFGMMQTSIQSKNDDFTNQNIYITSDEEIKKGDWCMSLCDDESYEEIYQCKDIKLVDEEDKKIILTTDQDLIKDGVQAIDDEFLEWFVKNPSCEEVEVHKIVWNVVNDFEYKIIIPKQEPKKVLTEGDIFNQRDIDAINTYIKIDQLVDEEAKKIQKQHLIDMMESDEELGLYEEPKMNKIQKEIFEMEQELGVPPHLRWHNSKPNQDIIKSEDDAKIFIDEINNPSQPNAALVDAFARHFGKPEHQLESEIEHLIIRWNLDGTRTAGNLTREIIKLIKS